jgi:hypothetical protein
MASEKVREYVGGTVPKGKSSVAKIASLAIVSSGVKEGI